MTTPDVPAWIVSGYQATGDGRNTIVTVFVLDVGEMTVTMPTKNVGNPALVATTVRAMLQSRQSTMNQLEPVEE